MPQAGTATWPVVRLARVVELEINRMAPTGCQCRIVAGDQTLPNCIAFGNTILPSSQPGADKIATHRTTAATALAKCSTRDAGQRERTLGRMEHTVACKISAPVE
ncbi:hypothetical protein DPSP01_000052 [Paraphaeosphaeria sporulosa]